MPRKKNLIVKDDTITVFVCDSCKAVRVDSHNEFCYTHGSFDGRLVGATS